MAPTLRSLVEDSRLALRAYGPPDALARTVAWVHTSELVDPAPFLEGGELLLTTGLALPAGQALQDYVDRLVTSGVSGLGFGSGLTHPSIPDGLLEAADRAGLPVLEVPRATPFIAISKAVSRALAAEEYAVVTRVNEAQHALTRAAVAGDGFASLIRRLARERGGWAALTDSAGTPVQSSSPAARERVGELAREFDRLRATRNPASAALTAHGEEIAVQSLGHGQTRGFLVSGRPGASTPEDRQIFATAASLLTLGLEQSAALDGVQRQLRTACFHLLLAGELAAVRRAGQGLWHGLPREPLVVVAAGGPADHVAVAGDLLDLESVRSEEAVAHARIDGQLAVIVGQGSGVLEWLARLPGRLDGLCLGISAPTTYADLSEGHRQAQQALAAGRPSGADVTSFPEVAARPLLSVLSGDEARAFADALLAPLRRHDETGRGDLVSSLRTYLEHHGQLDPAAARIGVHRHTLRNRMRKVEELLGRHLDSAGTRAELWLALELSERATVAARPRRSTPRRPSRPD